MHLADNQHSKTNGAFKWYSRGSNPSANEVPPMGGAPVAGSNAAVSHKPKESQERTHQAEGVAW